MEMLIVENKAKFDHPPNSHQRPISIVFTSYHHPYSFICLAKKKYLPRRRKKRILVYVESRIITLANSNKWFYQ